MASDNKLELVIEVQADKANAQIKGVNQSLADSRDSRGQTERIRRTLFRDV